MGDKMTFQESAGKTRLEKYEWDRMWLEDTYDSDAKRVLYIGDSISQGTFGVATKTAERKLIFNNLATSKAVDNPYYYPLVAMFVAQNERKDAIIVNNGLHGFHLNEDEYGRHYHEFIKKLKADNPDTPIFIVLTTAVSESNKVCDRVPLRNQKAIEIAKAENIGVIDLYSVAKANIHLLNPDGVHFSAAGYDALANEIVKSLKDKI